MGIAHMMAPALIKIFMQEITIIFYEAPAIGRTLHKALHMYLIIHSSCQGWRVYFIDDEIKIQRDSARLK